MSMRSGPKPLPFQLGMASLASAGLAGGTAFSETILQDFFIGIKKYQAHPFKRAMPTLPVVWQEGEVRLFGAQTHPMRDGVPVVLIPSMVNKSDILDLLPDRSFLRFLAHQGLEVYMLDWGNPAQDDGLADIDAAIAKRLLPAIESLGRPVQLLGYCMGGLFAVAVAALRPDIVKSCLLLATPWNFHDEKGALKARMSLMKPMATPYMKQYNRLPESWMQAVFATLDPEGSIKKFSSFAAMREGDKREEIFIAVEDWLNEGLDLPAGIASHCMEDWYEENRTFGGSWTVLDTVIRAGDLRCVTMVVAAKDDRIVPLDSALAFADQRLKCERLVCATGHVGLIAGKEAIANIWKPIADWFAVQQ
ncbi:MAG: poly-beta-hydroxybutyrate polymerase [Micavibrio aeruginosavorus]|uniref:Poly-beta-hydroxybutyrate polymerase n=1 Tax=Micavibrio aeruginosavorus TaxID=349221 RepID=A0A2W5PTM1_9BACT|nr:MAG: poly-beta-hydroxybutyrate polymerase [Micavibrio aeruginosavorus]